MPIPIPTGRLDGCSSRRSRAHACGVGSPDALVRAVRASIAIRRRAATRRNGTPDVPLLVQHAVARATQRNAVPVKKNSSAGSRADDVTASIQSADGVRGSAENPSILSSGTSLVLGCGTSRAELQQYPHACGDHVAPLHFTRPARCRRIRSRVRSAAILELPTRGYKWATRALVSVPTRRLPPQFRLLLPVPPLRTRVDCRRSMRPGRYRRMLAVT